MVLRSNHQIFCIPKKCAHHYFSAVIPKMAFGDNLHEYNIKCEHCGAPRYKEESANIVGGMKRSCCGYVSIDTHEQEKFADRW